MKVPMKKVKYMVILCLALAAVLTACRKESGSLQENKDDGIVDKSVVDTTYKVYYPGKDNIHLEGVSDRKSVV